MSASSPSWYDLLGLDPDASTDEIRGAWRSGIADLDPGDRRFTLLNQAAEVLLDAERRAAYDEERQADASAASEAMPTVVEEVAQQPSRDLASAAPEPTTDGGRSIPAWLLAGLGALAAALIGVCIWQAGEPTDQQVVDGTSDAQAAAERAIVAIVSYDYRSLDDDQARASSYMTDDFAEDYAALFAIIRENAPETKTILSSEVVDSSIVRSGDDRVQIFMFIDNPRTNAEITTPEIDRNQVTVTMEKVGDDWLVDDLKTTLPQS